MKLPFTIQDVRDMRQYWFSKWCNSVTIDEKEIYDNLYKACDALYKFMVQK